MVTFIFQENQLVSLKLADPLVSCGKMSRIKTGARVFLRLSFVTRSDGSLKPSQYHGGGAEYQRCSEKLSCSKQHRDLLFLL